MNFLKKLFHIHKWTLKNSGQAAHCFYRFECECGAKKENEYHTFGDITRRKYWTDFKNEY